MVSDPLEQALALAENVIAANGPYDSSDEGKLAKALVSLRERLAQAERERDEALNDRDEWIAKTQAMGEGRVRAEAELAASRQREARYREALEAFVDLHDRQMHGWAYSTQLERWNTARAALAGEEGAAT